MWQVFSDWISDWHVILICSHTVCYFRFHVSSSPPVVEEASSDQTQSRKAIGELRFQLTKMSHKVRLFKQYDEICKMTRRLVSISTLSFIHRETSVAIVGSIDQSLRDNFTMFPYLIRPILLAKFKTSGEMNHDLCIIMSNFMKAIPQNGDFDSLDTQMQVSVNNGHE